MSQSIFKFESRISLKRRDSQERFRNTATKVTLAKDTAKFSFSSHTFLRAIKSFQKLNKKTKYFLKWQLQKLFVHPRCGDTWNLTQFETLKMLKINFLRKAFD